MKAVVRDHRIFFTCLLLLGISLLLCVAQFRLNNLIPLGFACLLLVFVAWIRPKFRVLCAALPILTFSFLCLDAFVLHHRAAVSFRAWSPIGQSTIVEDVLPSPSGRARVYIVGNHWLDSGYFAYVSGGGLFPQVAYIHSDSMNPRYGRSLTANWNGGTFIVKEKTVVLRYTEDARRLETYLP